MSVSHQVNGIKYYALKLICSCSLIENRSKKTDFVFQGLVSAMSTMLLFYDQLMTCHFVAMPMAIYILDTTGRRYIDALLWCHNL